MKTINTKSILFIFLAGLFSLGTFYAGFDLLDDALIEALKRDDWVTAKAMILQGADVNCSCDITDAYGEIVQGTPLIKAVLDAKPKMVNLLLDKGANPNVFFKDMPLIIIPAAKTFVGNPSEKNKEIFLSLLKKIDINAQNKSNGNTILHQACVFCSPEMVKLLIERGADKTIKNNNGRTAYDVLVKRSDIYKNLEELKELLDPNV